MRFECIVCYFLSHLKFDTEIPFQKPKWGKLLTLFGVATTIGVAIPGEFAFISLELVHKTVF